MNNLNYKYFVQSLIGSIIGAVIVITLYYNLREIHFYNDDIALVSVSLLYMSFGVVCLVGTAFPTLGQHYLNFADAEELREERKALMSASACTSILGAALAGLPIARAGIIPPPVAIATIVLSVVVGYATYSLQRQRNDELMRAIAVETAAIAFQSSSTIIVFWSAAASLDLASPISPMSLLAILASSLLIGAFAATSQKGLLTPR